jgi:hypothetical protein
VESSISTNELLDAASEIRLKVFKEIDLALKMCSTAGIGKILTLKNPSLFQIVNSLLEVAAMVQGCYGALVSEPLTNETDTMMKAMITSSTQIGHLRLLYAAADSGNVEQFNKLVKLIENDQKAPF